MIQIPFYAIFSQSLFDITKLFSPNPPWEDEYNTKALTPVIMRFFALPRLFGDNLFGWRGLAENEAELLARNVGTDTLLGGMGGPPFETSSDKALVDNAFADLEFIIRRSRVLL